MALAFSWAKSPEHALFELVEAGLLIGSGFLLVRSSLGLNDEARLKLARIGVVAQVSLIGFLALELWAGAPLGQLLKGSHALSLRFTNHATSIAVMLFWPVVALMSVQGAPRSQVLALWLALAATLAVSQNSASLVAFVLASLVFWSCSYLRMIVANALLLGVLLVVFSAPWLSSNLTRQVEDFALPASWTHRLVIWGYFGERSIDKLLIGHGLGSSHGSQANDLDRERYKRIAQATQNRLIIEQFPTHPHNTIIQIWFEFGAIGIGLFCILIYSLYRSCWVYASALARGRYQFTLPATGTALLATYLVLANLSYGAFQEWWLAIVGLSIYIWNIAATLSLGGSAADSMPRCKEP